MMLYRVLCQQHAVILVPDVIIFKIPLLRSIVEFAPDTKIIPAPSLPAPLLPVITEFVTHYSKSPFTLETPLSPDSLQALPSWARSYLMMLSEDEIGALLPVAIYLGLTALTELLSARLTISDLM